MHELSLFKDLMHKIASISQEHEGKKIVKMKVKLGALSHLSAPHFQEHFDSFSKGTAAEGAELEMIEDQDERAPYAQSVILESVEIEDA